MKKMIYGVVLISAFMLLSSCNKTDDNETITKLKKENEELKEKLAVYEGLNEIYDSIDSITEKDKPTTIDNGKGEIPVYKENEEVYITDENKNNLYSLKIVNATTNLKDSDDLYTDGKPENTVEVTYEYKNYNVDIPMRINSQYMSAFDENGMAGKNQGFMNGQTEVTKNRTSQSTIWFVMKENMTNKDYIEIEYTNDSYLGFADAIRFKVPLEH